jgi:hypothetical protein
MRQSAPCSRDKSLPEKFSLANSVDTACDAKWARRGTKIGLTSNGKGLVFPSQTFSAHFRKHHKFPQSDASLPWGLVRATDVASVRPSTMSDVAPLHADLTFV